MAIAGAGRDISVLFLPFLSFFLLMGFQLPLHVLYDSCFPIKFSLVLCLHLVLLFTTDHENMTEFTAAVLS